MEIQSVLGAERVECQWDSESFTRSQYVYISKRGLTEVKALLARAGEEAVAAKNYEEEVQRVELKLRSSLEELEHVAADNDSLRRDLRAREVMFMARAEWCEKVMGALRKLRGVFGNDALQHEKMQELLKYVDEVLKGG